MTDERSKTDVSSDEVIRKYFDMVYKLALSQTKNQTFAEDVTQDEMCIRDRLYTPTMI